MLMRMPDGSEYDVPESDVRIAQSQYGAVPVSGAADSTATPGNPLAGAAGAATSALSGLKGVGIGAGGIGALFAARRLLNGKGAPPAATTVAPTAPMGPAADNLPSGLVRLTEEDIAKIPAFKDAQPGEQVRRVRYELERYGKPGNPPKRTTARPAAKPRRTTKPPEPIPLRATPPASARVDAPSSGPKAPSTGPNGPSGTVPISVPGKPQAVRGAKQRGVTKRQLATRPGATMGGDDMMAQLERSLATGQSMNEVGVPGNARSPYWRGIKGTAGKVPGALGILLSLLDAGSIPEQMDEAQEPMRQVRRQRLSPDLLDLIEEMENEQRRLY